MASIWGHAFDTMCVYMDFVLDLGSDVELTTVNLLN